MSHITFPKEQSHCFHVSYYVLLDLGKERVRHVKTRTGL